ncbi:unnamed protein product [Amoebophrya sp. A25]|nr:unnamed protein product [Amoebophrya sp. A25]|eukprot:GSA25T00001658001.1
MFKRPHSARLPSWKQYQRGDVVDQEAVENAPPVVRPPTATPHSSTSARNTPRQPTSREEPLPDRYSWHHAFLSAKQHREADKARTVLSKNVREKQQVPVRRQDHSRSPRVVVASIRAPGAEASRNQTRRTGGGPSHRRRVVPGAPFYQHPVVGGAAARRGGGHSEQAKGPSTDPTSERAGPSRMPTTKKAKVRVHNRDLALQLCYREMKKPSILTDFPHSPQFGQ